MSTMREHLNEMHLAEGEHSVKCAKIHKAISQEHRALAKSFGEDDEQSGMHETLADHHEQLGEAHTDRAAFHAKCAKALGGARKADEGELQKTADAGGSIDADALAFIVTKAVSEVLANKIMPDHVRGVIPSDVPSNIRAVPRYGQQDINLRDVPAEFQDMLKVEH